MTEIKALKPNLKWFQTKDTLTLEIDHRDIKNPEIKIEANAVHVKFQLNGNQYEDSLELFEEIKTEESTQQQSGYQFKIVLKKTKEEFWKGVTKNDKARKNIKVDWSNFNDSDEEVETEKENPMGNMGNMGNFDMGQFMQNQGQMGGNMGADDDSDDTEEEEHDHNECQDDSCKDHETKEQNQE